VEHLNSVNDEPEVSVEPREEAETVFEPTQGEEEQEAAEPADGEQKHVQTPEQNAWFAKQRREAEEAKAEARRAREQSERLQEALKGYKVEGEPDIAKLREERDYFYNLELERIRQDDLNKIKELYGDVAAKDVDEFGEQFAALRAGGVDAVVAYSAITQAKQALLAKTPPSIGGVSQSSARIKDFYTPEEVDAFGDDDYKDPKKMRAVRNSMTKWK
jgi:hypothetical protein